jgi:hypothetical protein
MGSGITTGNSLVIQNKLLQNSPLISRSFRALAAVPIGEDFQGFDPLMMDEAGIARRRNPLESINEICPEEDAVMMKEEDYFAARPT